MAAPVVPRPFPHCRCPSGTLEGVTPFVSVPGTRPTPAPRRQGNPWTSPAASSEGAGRGRGCAPWPAFHRDGDPPGRRDRKGFPSPRRPRGRLRARFRTVQVFVCLSSQEAPVAAPAAGLNPAPPLQILFSLLRSAERSVSFVASEGLRIRVPHHKHPTHPRLRLGRRLPPNRPSPPRQPPSSPPQGRGGMLAVRADGARGRPADPRQPARPPRPPPELLPTGTLHPPLWGPRELGYWGPICGM